MMPRGSLLRSHAYRAACACSLALVVYVMARAPLWNPVMAGARVRVASREIALVSAAWRCSERPYLCSTTVGGQKLVARVGAIGDPPITCSATFGGRAVPCAARLGYAPRPKPLLELGQLTGVSFEQVMLERPWRLLDLGLVGEQGPLHVWAGIACAALLALAASTLTRPSAIKRVGVASLTFVGLSGAWFLQLVLTGYID